MLSLLKEPISVEVIDKFDREVIFFHLGMWLAELYLLFWYYRIFYTYSRCTTCRNVLVQKTSWIKNNWWLLHSGRIEDELFVNQNSKMFFLFDYFHEWCSTLLYECPDHKAILLIDLHLWQCDITIQDSNQLSRSCSASIKTVDLRWTPLFSLKLFFSERVPTQVRESLRSFLTSTHARQLQRQSGRHWGPEVWTSWSLMDRGQPYRTMEPQ